MSTNHVQMDLHELFVGLRPQNLDTQNDAIFEAGDTCSKAHQFVVSICQILWLS